MITYRQFEMKDYQAVYDLWKASPGVGLSSADEKDAIAQFSSRNPGLCFIAEEDDIIVGTLFCGQDGRRGYIHHTAVSESHQRRGIGQKLVDMCLAELAVQGIQKCHLFVYGKNKLGKLFWERTGWTERVELNMFSKDIAK
ncbi:MAG: GNAT family N-acetyltransferase [Anaerolineaceae bacterium]|nr:GNAT family N-acetyltransferase [Anaerolineaceae bacterium]